MTKQPLCELDYQENSNQEGGPGDQAFPSVNKGSHDTLQGFAYQSTPEFLSLTTTDISDWIVSCCGDFPAHCRMFSSIAGLYPLDVSNISPLLSCDK